MARRRRRSAPKRRREPGQISHNEINRETKASRQRQKLLDLSNESIFRYDMEDILVASNCPPERVPSLVASIWSKASRQGVQDAEAYIREKATEGIYGTETETKLLQLLKRNSVYR